jgi:hypothetical protein
VREPPKGALGRATAAAEGMAAAVFRRQRDREPRVLLYHRPGDPRVLHPGSKGHDRLLEAAREMVELVDAWQDGSRASRDRPRREWRAER